MPGPGITLATPAGHEPTRGNHTRLPIHLYARPGITAGDSTGRTPARSRLVRRYARTVAAGHVWNAVPLCFSRNAAVASVCIDSSASVSVRSVWVRLKEVSRTAAEGLGGAAEYPGEMVASENKFGSRLEINGSINGGELALAFSYSELQYEEETIVTLAARYIDALTNLIQHCVNKQNTEHTPSDFGLQDKVSNQQLEAFLQVEEESMEPDDDFLFV